MKQLPILNSFTPARALKLSVWCFTLLFTTYFAAVLALIAGMAVSGLLLPVAVLMTLVVFWLLHRKQMPVVSQLKYAATGIVILLLCKLIAVQFYDTSWDGQWYHQVAVMKLGADWNPYHDPFYATAAYDAKNFLWVMHYPKFSWITGSVFYKLSDQIESGKLINLFVILIVFLNAFSLYGRMKINRLMVLLLALLTAYTPVAGAQVLSNYVDGLLGGFLTLILLQLVALEVEAGFRQQRWLLLCGSIIMVCNLKFSGLIHSGLIIVLFGIYWLVARKGFKVIAGYALRFAAAYILAIFFFGYNPYVTNYAKYKDPFYPVNEEAVYSDIARMAPEVLHKKNNLERLFIVSFSETNNDIHMRQFKPKIPLMVKPSELRLFASTDVRLSGFGPLFGLALLLSLVSLVLVVVRHRGARYRWLFFFAVSAIFFSTLIFPEGWWPRFAPQLFLLPVAVAVMGLYLSAGLSDRPLRILSVATSLVLFANIAFVAGANIYGNVVKTRLIRQELRGISGTSEPVHFNFATSTFQAVRRRLFEANVNYVEDELVKPPAAKELRTLYQLDGNGAFYIDPHTKK